MVDVVVGHLIKSEDIKHLVKLPCTIQDRSRDLPVFITQLGHNSPMLGIHLIWHHKVTIAFGNEKLQFRQTKAQVPPKPQESPADLPMVPLTDTVTFCWWIDKQKRYGNEVYGRYTVYELKKALKDSDKKLSLSLIIPKKYHKFLPLLSEVTA